MVEPRNFIVSGKDLALLSCETAQFPTPIQQLLQLERFAAANPAFYQDYPGLFSEAFPSVSGATLGHLSAAGFLYYRSIMMVDGLMDDESPDCPPQLRALLPIAIGCCQEESVKLLCTVFPLGSTFWVKWNERRKEYLRAYHLEREMMSEGTFDEATYLQIADDKAAFGKIAIDVLYLADESRRELVATTLLEAHREFSIGLQLMDDFQDFDRDARAGQINYAQYLLDEHYRMSGHLRCEEPVRRKKDMYMLGIGSQVLKEAEERFHSAMTILRTLEARVGFERVVQENIDTSRRVRAQIAGYLITVATKVRLYGARNPMPLSLPSLAATQPTAADRALYYCFYEIIEQANNCFPEIKHLMHLGKQEGFDNEAEVHVGDTFQRALLLDCLIDYGSINSCMTIKQLITQELDHLLHMYSREGVGGWCYFPSVREIAPDADDLGQALQCLARANCLTEIERLGKPLVRFVADNLFDEKTGAFTTWLIPKTDPSPLQQLQDRFNREKWGRGPDPEVVANLLYGIHIAGLSLPATMVASAETYLWQQRSPAGEWASRWYIGPYYGTYVSIRYLVRCTDRSAEDYLPTINYLLNAQESNGGFEANALSTSLALMTLVELLPLHPHLSASICRARGYLVALCNERPDEIVAHPFIIPRVGQPYGSRTLTLGYVLKALSQSVTLLA
jgi:hypothetical protein